MSAELTPGLSPSVLEISGLCKSFGGVSVLSEFDLKVESAERVALAILGQNGAGKTTLMNLVTRLIPYDKGSIEIFGHKTSQLSAKDLPSVGVARTFQTPRLLVEETTLDNVILGALARQDVSGRGRVKRAKEVAKEALEFVGLSSVANRYVKSLPFGNRKVVELARAWAMGPKVMLLDEPAAGLSNDEEKDLCKILAAIRDQGVALILIEHRMGLVAEVAKSVVMMDAGKVVFTGTPSEALSSEVVRERYLGSGFEATSLLNGPKDAPLFHPELTSELTPEMTKEGERR